MLSTLSLASSFGFGDRLGLATPGHIAAVKGTRFAPIFVQQSVRENARTGRTPQQVMDDARRALEAAHWDAPWGADADHLKSPDDLPPFVEAGYTLYTVDPGEHVDNGADTDPMPVLQQKARQFDWDELSTFYLPRSPAVDIGTFTPETLLRAVVKYGQAVRHTVGMYRRLSLMKDDFDFEISVDETDAPTSPLEHYFIASELKRLGVRFTSLAPRFIGRFEKGVDYIGDLAALEAEMAKHAAVTAHFGTYKLSLHSGSDKFSVYPLLTKYWGERVHVKTAGTSYLEALRLLARLEPGLFREIYTFACQRFETDRLSYHVSAQLDQLPRGGDLPALLDDFHAREVLHVTFGSVLAQFKDRFRPALERHLEAYYEGLRLHFQKHLQLLG
jgi:tagaturonate epimerase